MTSIAQRGPILWIGSPPDQATEQAFLARRLQIEQTVAPGDAHFAIALRPIFSDPSRAVLVRLIKAFLSDALIHGHNPIILARSEDIPNLQSLWAHASDRVLPREIGAISADDLAEDARDPNTCGGQPANMELEIRGCKLEHEHEILLKRALWGFNEVHLSTLDEGKSDALVLEARAQRNVGLEAGLAGLPIALPYLIKFERADYSKNEKQAFDTFVEGQIPFNQRPGFHHNRCHIGEKFGVIVGDFFDGAVSLSKVQPRAAMRPIIASLFDNGMRSWRALAERANVCSPGPIEAHLPNGIRASDISEAVIAQAKELGGSAVPQDLQKRLNTVSANEQFHLGIVHGDLHAGNVMVHLGEAVLIDFAYSKDRKAMSADLASLEVGLAFTTAAAELDIDCAEKRTAALVQWRAAVEELFTLKSIKAVSYQDNRTGAFAWLWDVCRQLHTYRQQIGDTERAYALILCAYLLRRARLTSNARSTVELQLAANALFIAERLLDELES